MAATDKILSDIGVISTLIENFPDSLFDFEVKHYNSGLEFLLDVLRACGVTEQAIINFIVAEVYGVYNEEGEANWYTLSGISEKLARGDLKVNEQNGFIRGIESSIKIILMGIFTSLFTCSAVPVLPNRVFDLDNFHLTDSSYTDPYLMPSYVRVLTAENAINDERYKLKIPISAIDALGLLSISPVSRYGRLYYNVNGTTSYYQKSGHSVTTFVDKIKPVFSGETYTISEADYYTQMIAQLHKDPTNKWYFTIQRPVANKLRIHLTVKNDVGIFVSKDFKINANETESTHLNIEKVGKCTITKIRFNGNPSQGGVVLPDEPNFPTDRQAWLYANANTFTEWESAGGGIKIDPTEYGSENLEKHLVEVIATANTTVTCTEEVIENTLIYKKIETVPEGKKYVTYSYLPGSDMITNDSPEFISVYEGENPNLLYNTNDMNAFIWYVINRGKKTTQEEKNHLMWDSRNKVFRKQRKDQELFPNTQWWASKIEDGDEFKNVQDDNGEYLEYNNNYPFYPIIQIERYDRNAANELLLRIPAQRYFAPRKRRLMYESGIIHPNRIYFNSSIYKFDWEYLQSINIFNIKFLLARFIENVTGAILDSARSVRFNFYSRLIQGKLKTAIKNIIKADDLEIEDCYKTFSNEDFDELLQEMFYERYTATEYKGESKKARIHNMDDYAGMLDSIGEGVSDSGTVTRTQKLVTEVMVTDGEDTTVEEHYDGILFDKLFFGIIAGIIESLFTPQVLLLAAINFQLLGLDENSAGLEEALTKAFLGIIKSIVKAVKDLIQQMLLNLINRYLVPLLKMMALLLYLEKLTNWLIVLLDAVRCVSLFWIDFGEYDMYKENRIDNVTYADIVPNNTLPESQSSC